MSMTRERLSEFGIPSHMHGGIIRYLEAGIWPGSFLEAVLCNDLMRAAECADDRNATCLYAYAKLLYNLPIGMYGSMEAMKQHCERTQAKLAFEGKEDHVQS